MNSVFSTSNAGYCSAPHNESGCIHFGPHGDRGISWRQLLCISILVFPYMYNVKEQ